MFNFWVTLIIYPSSSLWPYINSSFFLLNVLDLRLVMVALHNYAFSFVAHITLRTSWPVSSSYPMPLKLNDLWVLGSAYFHGLHVHTSDLYVFSEGRTPCRTAALIAETPSSNTDFKASCIYSSLHFFSQIYVYQFCNGLVVEYLERLKPSSSYLTWNSRELEQNKVSITDRLIC